MPRELVKRESLSAATFLLTALAAVAVELAMVEEGCSAAPALTNLAFEFVVTLAAYLWLRRRHATAASPPAWAGVALFVVVLLPWLIEPLRRRFCDDVRPTELLLLGGMCYLTLTLGALSVWRMFQRLAGLASMFLVLFAASLTSSNVVLAIGAGYALAGSLWLMHLNWRTLRHPLTSAGATRLPMRGVLAVGGCFVALAAFATMAPQSAIVALAGFFPSSGGSDWYDPDSRGGIGDGDGVVAAQHSAQSVGLTDSQVSIESQGPTLYDVFSDAYGEPLRPQKPPERAVALAPQPVLELEREAAENLHAGRDFSTVRGRRPPPKPMSDLKSRALLYVKGRTPLHLAAAAYEQFDGVRWLAADDRELSGVVDQEGESAWMRVPRPGGPDVFGDHEACAVKLSALRTDRMPTPPQADRFRMGQVNRADFFVWQKPGMLRMADRAIPPGVVVDVETRPVDWKRMPHAAVPTVAVGPRQLAAANAGIGPRTAELAKSWAAGAPRGWRQVESVIAELRRYCTLDPDAQAPADCTDSVEFFLLHSRRGPDYQFASAATVLLRSLGYSTRLVSGFYASPEQYDERSRHTPITRADAHFWLQIRLHDGVWIELEPTPGYELAGASPSWIARGMALIAAGWSLARAHATQLGVFALLGLAAVIGRERLQGGLATIAWRFDFAGVASERRVMATLRLLERRGRLAGLPRPATQSPAKWYRRLGAKLPASARADLETVLNVADWHTHAPRNQWTQIPWSTEEISASCRRLVASWTLAWLARSANAANRRRKLLRSFAAFVLRKGASANVDEERLAALAA